MARKRAEKKSKKKTLFSSSATSKIIIFFIIVFLILISYSVYVSLSSRSDKNGQQSSSYTLIDDFSVDDLQGYQGKIVVMDLWAVWCGPCKLQMREFIELYSEYDRDTLEIISVNIQPTEDIGDIEDFILDEKELGYDYTWVFVNDDGSIWQNYVIRGYIPTLYIFDQNGDVYYSSDETARPYEYLKQIIDELL